MSFPKIKFTQENRNYYCVKILVVMFSTSSDAQNVEKVEHPTVTVSGLSCFCNWS